MEHLLQRKHQLQEDLSKIQQQLARPDIMDGDAISSLVTKLKACFTNQKSFQIISIGDNHQIIYTGV